MPTEQRENKSHISNAIRDDLDKLGDEKRRRVLDVADKDPRPERAKRDI